MKIFEAVKDHPGLAIGGAIAIFAVLLLISKSSGGATQSIATPVTGATDNALAIAQLQAQVQSNSLAAQSAADQSHDAYSLQIAQLQEALGAKTVDAQQTVQLANTDASKQVALGAQQVQDNAQQLDYQKVADSLKATVQIAGLNTDLAQSYITSQQDVEMQILANNAQHDDIKDLYTHYLGRAPDAAGYAYWLNQEHNGLTGSALDNAFVQAAVANHDTLKV